MATKRLQIVFGVIASLMTISTVVVITVAMEMARQWRQETNEAKRTDWTNIVSSVNSTDDELEHYDVSDDVTDDERQYNEPLKPNMQFSSAVNH